MSYSATGIQYAAVRQLILCLKRHPITLPPEIIQMIASTAFGIDPLEWVPELQECDGQLLAPSGWFFVHDHAVFLQSVRSKRMQLRCAHRDEHTIE